MAAISPASITAGRQWPVYLFIAVLALASASFLATLGVPWYWPFVPVGAIVVPWLLSSPQRCLLLMLFSVSAERAAVRTNYSFGITAFEVIAVLTLLSALLHRNTESMHPLSLRFNRILFWLAFFLAANMAAFAFSLNLDDLRSVSHLVLSALVVVLLASLVRTEAQLRAAIWALALSALVPAAYSFLDYSGFALGGTLRTTEMAIGRGFEVVLRGRGSFTDPNILGSYLCLVMPLSFACARGSKGWRRALGAALALTLLALLSTSLSRGAFYGVSAGLVAFAFCEQRFLSSLKTFCLLGLLLLSLYFFLRMWGLRSYSPETVIGRGSTLGQGFEDRTHAWRGIAQAFYDHPIVGVGPAEASNWSQYVDLSEWDLRHSRMVAHNIFLDVAIGTGLAGLAPFLLLIAAATRCAYRNLKGSSVASLPWSLGLWSSWVALLVDGMAMSYLVFPFLWIAIGLAVANQRIRAQSILARG